ncbi:hypothetical protein [Streptosporangium longisporum]|uniref:hypothetical protein n=1 Tax=Streptosporangium longisporum TaxID=46187 RepID=UPI0031F15E80
MSIDEAALPAWARPYVTPAQRALDRGLLWILLVYLWRGRHPSRTSVAQRLYVHTVGRDRKEWDPTLRELAADLDLSERTVEPALAELEADGWIIVTRLHRRNIYQLSWPPRDVLAPPEPKVPRCGAPTAKGGRCTKAAGRGTDTPGVGPCQQHRDEPHPGLPLDLQPQSLRSPEAAAAADSTATAAVQEGDSTATVAVEEDGSTATTADLDRNGCVPTPQPLRPDTATVAVPYVGTFGTFKVRGPSQVLPVGQRTDRNARETGEAPAAQPRPPSLSARSIVAEVPRYRSAEPWVRRELALTIDEALHAGYAREAIISYAVMVADEATFKAHQHLPELREALRRLTRDTALGDAPEPHPAPESGPDRPWSPEDHESWRRAVAHLGADPKAADSTGTA